MNRLPLDAASILALAQQSLLGWWKLDETSGTTATEAKDVWRRAAQLA